MNHKNSFKSAVFLVFFLLLIAPTGKTEPVKVGHVTAELISEVKSIQPGHPFWVGLHLKMDEHWHVYWRNPGDAGTPPTIEWDLPEGFTAGEIRWPYPETIMLGPLANYGYNDEVILPIKITPPDKMDGGKITLNASADWLVCREACIPGEADLSIDLPISKSIPVYNRQSAELINAALQKLPIESPGLIASAKWNPDNIILTVKLPENTNPELSEIYFYPFERGVIAHAANQLYDYDKGILSLTISRDPNVGTKPDTLKGILYNDSGWRGQDSEKALMVSAVENNNAPAGVAAASTSGISSFWIAILFAFAGGIILNLMPCVLPVLSLKIMGFVQQSQESRKKSLAHGLIFTSGVLVSFWILAGALLALQAGGASLGWGFQLQSPGFLIILSGFLFLFGLNMLGVFEIGTSMTGVGSGAAAKSGWFGSFLNGVTATIVATPCTAPFMGSALGYSLAQPPIIALMIFTALGLGMATPYIILSGFPRLLKFLPKPGAWMETLKQVMGFLLIATVIWLAWVLSIQAGSTAVVALLATLFMLGLGAWIMGKWGTLAVSKLKRTTAYTVFVVLLGIGIGFGLVGISFSSPTSAQALEHEGSLQWQPYSAETVAQLRQSGKPVLIDFTAAWCLSCQVNERVAFGSQEVRDKIDRLGITTVKADWTSRDENITKALAEYGRNSVPFYVIYGKNSADPIILPEILTPAIVLDALDRIDESQQDRTM